MSIVMMISSPITAAMTLCTRRRRASRDSLPLVMCFSAAQVTWVTADTPGPSEGPRAGIIDVP